MINSLSLVRRHNPSLHGFDVESPFQIGNGEFAFAADVTGLQSFPRLYEAKSPLGTQLQWGWHTRHPVCRNILTAPSILLYDVLHHCSKPFYPGIAPNVAE